MVLGVLTEMGEDRRPRFVTIHGHTLACFARGRKRTGRNLLGSLMAYCRRAQPCLIKPGPIVGHARWHARECWTIGRPIMRYIVDPGEGEGEGEGEDE